MRTCNPGPTPSPLQHDHGLAILRCNASDVSAELRRLPRRQVDALHGDVRSLVLQFQLSPGAHPGATKQGSPMPRRASTKKVPLLCTHARTPHSTRQVAAPHREPTHTYLQCATRHDHSPTQTLSPHLHYSRPWYTLQSSIGTEHRHRRRRSTRSPYHRPELLLHGHTDVHAQDNNTRRLASPAVSSREGPPCVSSLVSSEPPRIAACAPRGRLANRVRQ